MIRFIIIIIIIIIYFRPDLSPLSYLHYWFLEKWPKYN